MAALHFLMAVYALSEDELVHAPDVEAIATYAEKRSGLADLESYNIVRNPKYERVMALLDKLGYAAVDEEAICRPSAASLAEPSSAPRRRRRRT
ncbi:hypothetical protein JL720_14912 [Aureococcus anophagefferens]|nr:hypothetical protein JL720_14912 [Aureococcus anophagefferens]